MSNKNSNPKTLESRNPFAQSTFAAQLTEATISGDRRIESAKTLGRSALFGLIGFIVVAILLVALISSAGG